MILPMPSDAPTGRTQSLLFSPFGVGKTTMAATASAQCPAHLTAAIVPPPPGTPVTTLDDIAWIGFDRNALAGFAPLKIRVPLYYDLSGVAPAAVLKELLEVVGDIQKRGVPHVVVDTLTALDTQFTIAHRLKATVNKMAFYDAILADHMRVYDALRQTDAALQLLAHVKAAFDADDAAKARRQTMEIPDFTAHVTGQAGGRYKADCDNIFMLRRKRVAVPNGKPQMRVVALTQPQGGAECKVRGGTHLPEEIDADWRVIRAAWEAL